VLTSKLISACFDHPVRITRDSGRWVARATSGADQPAPARR
jgi:iron complex transport system ATP-binding protein